jgi:hypothetical protein
LTEGRDQPGVDARGPPKQWQAKSGDTLEVPATNQPYVPVDLTGKRRTPDKFQPEWIVKKYF